MHIALQMVSLRGKITNWTLTRPILLALTHVLLSWVDTIFLGLRNATCSCIASLTTSLARLGVHILIMVILARVLRNSATYSRLLLANQWKFLRYCVLRRWHWRSWRWMTSHAYRILWTTIFRLISISLRLCNCLSASYIILMLSNLVVLTVLIVRTDIRITSIMASLFISSSISAMMSSRNIVTISMTTVCSSIQFKSTLILALTLHLNKRRLATVSSSFRVLSLIRIVFANFCLSCSSRRLRHSNTGSSLMHMCNSLTIMSSRVGGCICCMVMAIVLSVLRRISWTRPWIASCCVTCGNGGRCFFLLDFSWVLLQTIHPVICMGQILVTIVGMRAWISWLGLVWITWLLLVLITIVFGAITLFVCVHWVSILFACHCSRKRTAYTTWCRRRTGSSQHYCLLVRVIVLSLFVLCN